MGSKISIYTHVGLEQGLLSPHGICAQKGAFLQEAWSKVMECRLVSKTLIEFSSTYPFTETYAFYGHLGVK